MNRHPNLLLALLIALVASLAIGGLLYLVRQDQRAQDRAARVEKLQAEAAALIQDPDKLLALGARLMSNPDCCGKTPRDPGRYPQPLEDPAVWALVDGELVLGGQALEEIEEAGPAEEAPGPAADFSGGSWQFGPEWLDGKSREGERQ